MSFVAVLLALSPLLLIFVLLLWKRMAADVAGVLGLALTVLLALTWFGTSPNVVGNSLLAGVIGSCPWALCWRPAFFRLPSWLKWARWPASPR